jgi:glutamate dehydrogenase (NAD(P)+)
MINALQALSKINLKPQQTTAVVQGFGNVGSHAARLLAEQGIKVIGIADASGGYYDKKGIDLKDALNYALKNGSLKGYSNATKITNEELLTLPCDVLVPAALQNVITYEIAKKIQCKIIVEGANGPTLPEADTILNDKGIIVVPDILANSGGVTVSYFEWVQNKMGYYWTEEEVNQKHDEKMKMAFDKVWNNAQKYKTSMRMGAYITALEKLQLGIKMKGHY